MAIGFGDVKLAGLMGVFLSWHCGLIAMAAAVLRGALIEVVTLLLRRGCLVNFAPCLALGTFLVVLSGEPLRRWVDALVSGTLLSRSGCTRVRCGAD